MKQLIAGGAPATAPPNRPWPHRFEHRSSESHSRTAGSGRFGPSPFWLAGRRPAFRKVCHKGLGRRQRNLFRVGVDRSLFRVGVSSTSPTLGPHCHVYASVACWIAGVRHI